MLTPLLLAAVEAHETVAHAPSLPEQYGLEWKLVVIQAISFLILFAVLYWKGIKPIVASMEERATKIEAGLKYSEEMKLQLASTQQQTEAALREAQQKAQSVIAEAQKSAKVFADKQQQEAIAQSAAMITKAQQTIELEKKKMLAEARTEIARLVVTTTQRVLAKELSESERARYNDAASRELTQV